MKKVKSVRIKYGLTSPKKEFKSVSIEQDVLILLREICEKEKRKLSAQLRKMVEEEYERLKISKKQKV